MKHSGIEWSHRQFNPWIGCVRISPACDHCYAADMAHRYHYATWGRDTARRPASEAYWRQPLVWDRTAQREGIRCRVFCASMGDIFEDRRDLDAARERVWSLILATPHLDWILLTKRPEGIGRLVPPSWAAGEWPSNIWLGCTAEDQKRADERIPHLLRHASAVRFISCEPMRTSIDLSPYLVGLRRIDWVIGGGESGLLARPSPVAWMRSLREQCLAAGIPFFFKQWGNHAQNQNGDTLVRLKTKKERVLDGITWDQFPTVPVAAFREPRTSLLVAATGWDDLPTP